MSDSRPEPTSDSRPDPKAGRTRAIAYGGLVLGGLVGLVSTGRTWASGQTGGAGVGFTGTEVTGGLSQAVPVVLLLGALLSLALRSRGRHVVGGLLAVLAILGALGVATDHRPDEQQVEAKVAAVTLGDPVTIAGSGWPWIEVAGLAVGVLGALVMARYAGRWPTRTARFERDTGLDPQTDDPAVLWKAMDAGVDPTVEAGPGVAVESSTAGSIGSRDADGARMSDVAPDQSCRSARSPDESSHPDESRSPNQP